MIAIDCAELSEEEMLALAAAIGDIIEGKGVPVIHDNKILIDHLSGAEPKLAEALSAVHDFISRRKDAAYYSTEVDGDKIVVHSPDPLNALQKKSLRRTPPNSFQCPNCGYLASNEDQLTMHMRVHDILRGLGS